jgi:hypothetical protein
MSVEQVVAFVLSLPLAVQVGGLVIGAYLAACLVKQPSKDGGYDSRPVRRG